MTIVAFRCFRVAELGDFAVIGVEICFGNIFVATAAFGHDVQLESLGIRPADRVRTMTITADRQFLLCLADLQRVNAALELLLNAMVAASARGRNILGIHRRFRILQRQNTVRRVAACAGSRNRQAAFHQSLAMNTFCVPFYDFMLTTSVSRRGFLSFPMTACAENRYVGSKRWRFRIQFSQDSVGTVTFFACWTVQIALRFKLSMHALDILCPNFRMARGTIDFLLDCFAGPNMRCVDAGVTLTARNFAVTRIANVFPFHKQGSPIGGSFQLFPLMATQAILVRHPL